LAVKDNIDLAGYVTTAGSELFAKTRPPAKRDAACLAIARQRNVQIVGKTNVTEFALGVSGINAYFGTPKSPLKPNRRLVPGGSSSGSAVAVATGLADVALGTDTAGSIRVPAAFCGVYGLKTTYGLVPLDGVVPISPLHLDTVGPLAKDIPRLVQGMDLLERGFSAKYRRAVAEKPAANRIRVGRLYVDGTDPAIDRAVDEALARTGFQVVRLSEKFKQNWEQAQKDGTTVAVSDGWVSDREYADKEGVSVVTKATIALGRVEHATSYRPAVARKPQWQAILRNVFRDVDFIAVPTIKREPPSIPFFGRTALMESRVLSMQNTVAVNYAGNPAIAIPVPLEDQRVPVTSLQLIGPRLSEAKLINAARLVEEKVW
jgi:Asp-tRNA(Asn)/Glu-tRNA(Gln) amidotransferase A subunit family amidase